jgi:hypothetical protein
MPSESLSDMQFQFQTKDFFIWPGIGTNTADESAAHLNSQRRYTKFRFFAPISLLIIDSSSAVT